MANYDNLRSFAHRRRADLIIGLILTLAVAGCMAYMIRHLLRTDPANARRVGLPLPVQTIPAAIGTLRASIGASGTIQQSATVTLSASIAVRVNQVPVDLGSIVKEGDLLVQMDDRLMVAKVDTARINAERTGKQLHRMEVLEERGLGTAIDTETARGLDAEARKALIEAEINLSNCRVQSPVEGVVMDRMINPQETPQPGQKLVTLGTLNPVMMVANVSEDKISFIRLGMTAEIGTDAFPGVTFTGDVAKIDAAVSAKTRTFEVYIKIANPDLRLRPGVTGFARLSFQKMALTIPSTAVMNPVGDRATVFVADKNNRAHLREVRRGMAGDGLTEILDGLQEGEAVVTGGQLTLRDQDRILPNRSGSWNAD